jgi:glycerophosphoryl diester phosphodiesterase
MLNKPAVVIYLLFMVMETGVAQNKFFDLQGHRGARGIKPENTVPAFLSALDYGVTTLELDVVISKDKKVVVSHEPWMSSEICLQPDGSLIPKGEQVKFNIYQMNYDAIKQFDCGSLGNPRFPQQEKLISHKPLLKEVIQAVENQIRSFSIYEVDYNIEIKSRTDGDNRYHPSPEEFSDLVYGLIDEYLPWERIVIQSFDVRVLKYFNTKYPHVRLALLIENTKPPEKNLQELGFIPSIYSPYFKLLKKEHIDYLKKLKPNIKPLLLTDAEAIQENQVSTTRLRVIPWTVNEVTDMKRLKEMGVDGLITDYPNRAAEIGLGVKRNENEKPLPSN